MIDTRLITSRDNAKAAAAALDDSRADIHELLTENPELGFMDRMLLEVIAKSLEQALGIIDRCIGGLVRIADRWTA